MRLLHYARATSHLSLSEAISGQGEHAAFRYYVPNGMTRKCGPQIPINAKIKIIKFLPEGRAIAEYQGKRFLASTFCCWKKPKGTKPLAPRK